jgi:hypothetical protein
LFSQQLHCWLFYVSNRQEKTQLVSRIEKYQWEDALLAEAIFWLQ